MVLMVACAILVAAGLAAIMRWGGVAFRTPLHIPVTGPTGALRRATWWLCVLVTTGVASGLSMAGAGGRLAMRLLAATAGPAAQGRVTEADQVVGRITSDGTIGFMIFVGLFFGTATAALYLIVRRWLPPGRLGGLAFGALLLIVAGPRIDPLRADNPDFDIVGPGWISLLVFTTLALGHGMVVATVAGVWSRRLPAISGRPAVLVRYAPMLALVPAAPVAFIAAVVCVGAVTIRSLPASERLASSRLVDTAGRTVLVAVAAVATPGLVHAAADIASRGP